MPIDFVGGLARSMNGAIARCHQVHKTTMCGTYANHCANCIDVGITDLSNQVTLPVLSFESPIGPNPDSFAALSKSQVTILLFS